MKKLSHVTTLVTGDWSDDGHGKTDTITIRSNLSSEEIGEAYELASKRLGFNFISDVAADYEDSSLSFDKFKVLVDAGLNIEKVFGYEYDIQEAKKALVDGDSVSLWANSYRDIYLFIVKLGDEGFEYEIAEGSQLHIGGYGLFE